MSKTFQTRIKHKKDTHANWTTNNPVLLDGEIAIVEMPNGDIRQKVGDGSLPYVDLPFDVKIFNSSDEPVDAINGDIWVTETDESNSNPLAIRDGGTGAANKQQALANLGVTISAESPQGGQNGDIWIKTTTSTPGYTIWEGNWTSGTITVPGISKHRLFAISTFNASSGAAQGTNIIASLESDAFIRGMGGYATQAAGDAWAEVTHYYVNIDASGDTLTFNYAHTSAGVKLGIDRIDVLV